MPFRFALSLLVAGSTGATPVAPLSSSSASTASLPAGLESEVLASVCNDPCAGTDSIVLYRDRQGSLKRILYGGDHAVCSHSMNVWYDASGRELLRFSNKSVSESEATRRRTQVDAILRGLSEAEALDCPSLSR